MCLPDVNFSAAAFINQTYNLSFRVRSQLLEHIHTPLNCIRFHHFCEPGLTARRQLSAERNTNSDKKSSCSFHNIFLIKCAEWALSLMCAWYVVCAYLLFIKCHSVCDNTVFKFTHKVSRLATFSTGRSEMRHHANSSYRSHSTATTTKRK